MRSGVLRPAPLLSVALAAVAVMAAVSCQPRPDTREADQMRTEPTTLTGDHHPPPRMSEP